MATEQIQKVTVSICEDVWHVHLRDKLAAFQKFTNIYLLYLLKKWINFKQNKGDCGWEGTKNAEIL